MRSLFISIIFDLRIHIVAKHQKAMLSISQRTACQRIYMSTGGNTQQGTNNTVTCLPSRKLSMSDEPNMHDTAGEAGTSL